MPKLKREPPRFARQEFKQVIADLVAAGWLKEVEEIDSNCVVATHTQRNFRRTGKIASEGTNGFWHPHHKNLRWENGFENFYIINGKGLDDLARVRNLTYEHTDKLPGWSMGSCAAAWLKWALRPTPRHDRDGEILDGGYLNYHESIPGKHEWATYYDATSCYYQMLQRLQTVRGRVNHEGKFQFDPFWPEEQAKWRAVLELVEEEKKLRNSIWGVMLGTQDPKICFRYGQEVTARFLAGHSYAAAALIARSAWEICRAAACEVACIYSQTDGVFSTNGHPHYWDTIGIEHSIKSQGPVDIKYQHSYRFKGGKKTDVYRRDQPYGDVVTRPAPAPREWHLEWLA